MPLMTQRAYAVRIGKTAQYVNKLVQQGKIRKVGNKIDSRQADLAIRQTRERVLTRTTAADRVGRRAKSGTKSSAKAASAKVQRPHRSSTPRLPKGSLTEARTERERAQAALVELDLEERRGNLLPKQQVLEAERQKNANLKAGLRSLPRNLAPLLARTTSAAEVEEILLREVDLLLQRLAANPLAGEQDVPPPAPLPPAEPPVQHEEVAA